MSSAMEMHGIVLVPTHRNENSGLFLDERALFSYKRGAIPLGPSHTMRMQK